MKRRERDGDSGYERLGRKRTSRRAAPRASHLPQDVRVGLAKYKRIIRESHKALRAYIRCGAAMYRLEKAFLDADIDV